MAIPDPTYATGTLLGVLNQVKKPVFHLRDRYFPFFNFSKDRKVYWDTVEGRARIAPYVHPRHPGTPVERRGHKMDSLEAPYVKPVTVIDPDDMFNRTPGETVMGDLDPQQREDIAVTNALLDHDEQISVREEAQCAEGLRTGMVTVWGEGYDTFAIDFGRHPSLTETLVGSGFNTANFDVIQYIEDRALRVYQRSNGARVDEVTMDPAAWKAFKARLSNEQRQQLFNTTRGSESKIELGPMLPGDVVYMGQIGQFQFFVYTNEYDDHDGSPANMMPEGQLILTGAALQGVRCYAAIRDRGYQAKRHFPKVIVKENPYGKELISQSAPIMSPWRVNASFGARVLV